MSVVYRTRKVAGPLTFDIRVANPRRRLASAIAWPICVEDMSGVNVAPKVGIEVADLRMSDRL